MTPAPHDAFSQRVIELTSIYEELDKAKGKAIMPVPEASTMFIEASAERRLALYRSLALLLVAIVAGVSAVTFASSVLVIVMLAAGLFAMLGFGKSFTVADFVKVPQGLNAALINTASVRDRFIELDAPVELVLKVGFAEENISRYFVQYVDAAHQYGRNSSAASTAQTKIHNASAQLEALFELLQVREDVLEVSEPRAISFHEDAESIEAETHWLNGVLNGSVNVLDESQTVRLDKA